MRGLSEKVIVVAGDGSGIGAASARRLAAEGCVSSSVTSGSTRPKLLPAPSATTAETRPPCSTTRVTRPRSKLASRYGKQGLRINAIRPIALVQSQLDAMPQDFVADWIDRVPSGRSGTPDDAAALVAFLFSDDASYVGGQIWSVNGGMILNSCASSHQSTCPGFGRIHLTMSWWSPSLLLPAHPPGTSHPRASVTQVTASSRLVS